MTRRTANLELLDGDWLEIHPDDAARLWIETGDRVSVRSRVGRIETESRASPTGSSPATCSPRSTSPRSARTC